MSTIKTTFSIALLVILIAAGAVVAEPLLPRMSSFYGDKLVETCHMTPREHTLYLKM